MERARPRDPPLAAYAPGELGTRALDRVALAPRGARDLPARCDARPIENALDRGPDADDQLEVVGRSGRIEERRRRVTLDVDDDLAPACGLRARIGERGEELRAVFGERGEMRALGGCARCIGIGRGL